MHVQKAEQARLPALNGRQVPRISAYLVAGHFDDTPARLIANTGKAFIGSYLLGMGFTFDDVAAEKGEAEPLAEMRRLIAKDPRNSERIKPYLGGEEVNTSPNHAYHRYAIDFEAFPLQRNATPKPWADMSVTEQQSTLGSGIVPSDYCEPVAKDWPDLLDVVERLVKPKRHKDNRESYKRFWWRYAERRAGLSLAVQGLPRLSALSRVSPQMGIATIPSTLVPAESLVVFTLPAFSCFAALQSRIHEIWVRFFSSSMKDDLRYAPSDCFETFPFPPGYETDPGLEAAGQTYHDHRAALMIAANEGMTETYNRFHNAEERSAAIQQLRELHDAMDQAVLRAYGWDDLADTLKPVFLTPETEDDHTYQTRYFWPAEARDEVLARLLALNAQRHAEEVAAGIAPKQRNKAKPDAAHVSGDDDGDLLDA